MEEFNSGDLVKLKSGGPAMTVSSVESNYDTICCVWFDGKDRKEASFVTATLKKIPETPADIREF